jgi:3',5'-cyclic AMP phosphodiesterase CpdA
MKFIQISDLHFRASNAFKVEALINNIISHYKDEDKKPLVVVTGDLVEGARKSEMEKCYIILKRLKDAGHDILICSGNHDVKTTRNYLLFKVHGSIFSTRAYNNFNSIFTNLLPQESWNLPDQENDLKFFPKVNKYGNTYFIGLDSNNKERLPTGSIGSEQMENLKLQIERIKAESEAKKIVVYLHHNIFWFDPGVAIGRLDANRLKLTDRYDLRNLLKDNVEVVLFGHFHRNIEYSSRAEKLGIKIINLAGNCVFSRDIITWFEFDMNTISMTKIEKSIV